MKLLKEAIRTAPDLETMTALLDRRIEWASEDSARDLVRSRGIAGPDATDRVSQPA